MTRRSEQRLVGDIQPDGSMLYTADVPRGVEAVEINGCVFTVPAGATQMRIEIRTSDDGHMRTSARPVWEGDTTG